MSNLTTLTLAAARDGLKAKTFSATELTQAHLKAVEQTRALNAYITETPELALKQAAASDAKIAKGEAGALEGLPLGIKDLFCTEGVRTTAASKILSNFVPQYESTITSKLLKAGAVTVGKTNLDEFAMGSSNMTSHFGAVENPWRRAGDNRPLVPGGSSGGSAAAVAAARSASPPPSAASSASSRRMAVARAGASSPSPRRSTRPGPSPAR